jgi:ribosomal protein S18 acetylase RimI-like enzyme
VKKNLKIIKLNTNYSYSIENIWSKSIPQNVKSIIGKKIVYFYIKEFFKNNRNIGLGLIKKKKLIGFVLFGNDKKILRNVLSKNFLFIIYSFCKSLFLLRVKNISNYFNAFFFLCMLKIIKLPMNRNCELLVIAIHPRYQGVGDGSYLLSKSLKLISKKFFNYKYIYVKTLKKSHANINYYKKNNFKEYKNIYNQVYLRYKIKL